MCCLREARLGQAHPGPRELVALDAGAGLGRGHSRCGHRSGARGPVRTRQVCPHWLLRLVPMATPGIGADSAHVVASPEVAWPADAVKGLPPPGSCLWPRRQGLEVRGGKPPGP